MTTETTTLTAFLLECIAADEERAASDIDHFCDSTIPADRWITMYAERLIATCAAHRAIVEFVTPDPSMPDNSGRFVASGVLALLASIYKDAPGFDSRWTA